MSLPPLREVIARYGLSASKALGQNFLFDEQLLDRIAAIPGDLQGRNVLEVGPGPGGLTRALLRTGAKVTAIEMDRRCLPALAELSEAFPGQLTVIEGDAMKVKPAELFGPRVPRVAGQLIGAAGLPALLTVGAHTNVWTAAALISVMLSATAWRLSMMREPPKVLVRMQSEPAAA